MFGVHLLRGLTVTVLRLVSRIASEAILFHEFNKFLGRAIRGSIRYRRNQLPFAEASLLHHVKAPIRTITVKLSSGIEIYTIIAGAAVKTDFGNGEKPTDHNPIVLLHGHSMGGATFFRNVDDLLKQGYTSVYMPDLPGFGRSSRPRFSYKQNSISNQKNSINFFLIPLIEWINKLHINNFTILGHSLGGYIAYEYLKNQYHRKQIKQLILISPAAISRNTSLSLALWFRLTPQRFLTHGGLLAQLLFNGKYPNTPAYNLSGFRNFTLFSNSISYMSGDAAAAAILKFQRKGLLNWSSECTSPLTEKISYFNCPIHIIGGTDDRLVSMDSLRSLYQTMMQKGNQVAITILSKADHAPHIVEPVRFAQALKRVRVSMDVVSKRILKCHQTQLAC